MVLNKRIKREFKENFARYLGIFLLIFICEAIVCAYSHSSDILLSTIDNAAITNNREDGELKVYSKLSEDTLNKIDDLGVSINEDFYLDYKLNDKLTLRILKERNDINKISLINGTEIVNENDVMLDNKVALANNYEIGDSLNILDKDYNICGYGASPDYVTIIQNSSDLVSDSKNFGLVFMSDESFDKVQSEDINYSYTFKLNGSSSDDLRNIIKNEESNVLLDYTLNDSNSKITKYNEDISIDKSIAVAIGVVLNIIVGFILAMSLVHIIDKESPILGALYSLGYVKRELVYHFMVLPMLLVTVASMLGTAVGIYSSRFLSATYEDSYSYPILQNIYPPSLFIIGIAVPVVIVLIINFIILNKKLSMTPLQLLRKEKKSHKIISLNLNKFSFVTKFRLREFLRDISGNVMLFIGIAMASFLMVFGFGVTDTFNNYLNNVKDNVTYNYTYVLKKPVDVTSDGTVEKCNMRSISVYNEVTKNNMDVILQGINQNTSFFDFSIDNDDSGIYISNAVSKKFNINVGDNFTFKDSSNNECYSVEVKGIVEYYTGLYVFMNRIQLNNLVDEKDDYYNAYLSEDTLNIDDTYIYHKTTSNEVIDSVESVIESKNEMRAGLIAASIIVFIIVMYLILKMLIDKSTFSISLVKVFGYTNNELNKIYLGSSFYTVILSMLISLPISMLIFKKIYPIIVAHVQSYMFIKLEPLSYLIMLGISVLTYFIDRIILEKHLYSVKLSEILKDRE